MPLITLFICIQLEVEGIMFLVKNQKQDIFFNIICSSSMICELHYHRKLCQPFGHSLLIFSTEVSVFVFRPENNILLHNMNIVLSQRICLLLVCTIVVNTVSNCV